MILRIVAKIRSGRQARVPKKRRRSRVWTRRAVVSMLAGGMLFAHVTNPFTNMNLVQDPYTVTVSGNGSLHLLAESPLIVKDQTVFRDLGWLKSAIHMFNNAYLSPKNETPTGIEQVIDHIHSIRFDPRKPYLISGDHFSVLYIRSLGIFYASTLDPRTARSSSDWFERESIYLKTTAYALDVFDQAPELSTTIVPIGTRYVTLNNVFTKPSDSLFSLLYAIRVMQSPDEITNAYPFAPEASSSAKLETQEAANQLLADHKVALKRHLQTYLTEVVDPVTGLIRKDITLSGTKDSNMRQSAFYDNVILWKTHQLAQQLGLESVDPVALETLKQHILQKFWLPTEGYFLEDLSAESAEKKIYSSDWLIALQTGFLNPANPQEQPYFERSIAYIQAQKLDQPFPLKYQVSNRSDVAYPVVKFLAPSYSGQSIWSHWGMEYVKMLALLYKDTGDTAYLTRAKEGLAAYTANIVKFNGYPELYSSNGNMFTNFFYHSVHQTGWVVSFEQARELLKAVDRDPSPVLTYAANK